MKPIVILAWALFISLKLSAQQFGGFPPSTRWKQINSDTVRVIFSQGAEKQAMRIATLIHKLAADTPHSLGPKLRKINTLLQSRTTLANGYVALGPWRSEYYLVPSSNLFEMGNLPWQDQLAIHEFRHVHQYNNFNNGIAKGFFFLFGEQGRAFANAITIPDWFFEGDAVHAETANTPSGRGRTGLFHSGYNSLWLEGKQYSWQKLRNRSMKHYVPDHYQLGYLLTNYGYAKYGDAFWKKITQDASRFKGVFYPWQKAIQRHAGVKYKDFRKDAFAWYQSRLDSSQVDGAKLPNRTVTDYFFPQKAGRDSLLYMKRGYNKVPAFYVLHDGKEEKIRQRGISFEEWFAYHEGKIVYTAYSTHPRWGYTDYSDIVMMDLHSGKEKRFTKKEKMYTPSFSPSGNQLVAVNMTDSLESELVVFDMIRDSRQTFRGGDILFVNPRFIDETRIVTGIRQSNARLSLEVLDISTGKYENLVDATYATMGHPFVQGDTVYFTAGLEGNDELYAVRLQDKKLFRLTKGATGNYFPAASGDSLVWSHFTSNGYEWRTRALRDLEWKEVAVPTAQRSMYPVALSDNVIGEVRRERLSMKRYDKGTNLINFHSWAPNYGRPETSFSLYSDNILNTFSNQLYYRHNSNEKSHAVGWNSSYGGFFPVINAGVEYIFNRNFLSTAGRIFYDQYEMRIGANVPLNFSRQRFYRFLNVGSNLVYSAAEPTGTSRQLVRGTATTYLHHFLTASQYKQMALQHIYPKLGYAATLQHRHRMDEKGFQTMGSANVYLPSFGNHSIVLQGSFQNTDTNNVIFSNRFDYSRGYDVYYFSTMYRVGANYHFPILYPDLGLGSIVYFRRLRGNLFYDFTRVFSNDRTLWRDQRSTGGELFFDTKWWNQQEVSFGIRVSYLLDNGFSSADRKGRTWVEFILPLDLIPD